MRDPIDDDLPRQMAGIPELAGTPPSAWTIERLPSLTNRTLRLTGAGRDLVLRLPGKAARYISRAQEIHNAKAAAEAGIAPPLLHADAGTGVLLLDFVAGGHALTAADFANPATARAAGALLGRLHRSGMMFHGKQSPFPTIDLYLSLAGPSWLDGLRARAEALREALDAEPAILVPSHVDPNPANFIAGKERLLLVDWEYAAMAEPAWDIAAALLEAAPPPDAAAALLAGYDAAPPPRRIARMTTALHLVAASWALAELRQGNAAPGLMALAESHAAACAARLDAQPA